MCILELLIIIIIIILITEVAIPSIHSHVTYHVIPLTAALREQELFALSNDGTLAKLRLEYAGLSTSAADWGKWYAGMDSFGTLIMIASSLLRSIS